MHRENKSRDVSLNGFSCREVTYGSVPRGGTCLLGVDMGGTRINFGVFSVEKKSPKLLISLHGASQKVDDVTRVMSWILSYLMDTYQITIARACLGAAGVISEGRDTAKPTNLSLRIDARDIEKKTGLPHVILINDFEAVGYGIGLINQKDLLLVNNGVPRAYANKAIIGAGTGLGKGIIGWDEKREEYVPLPSEGGHADFPVHTEREFALIHSIGQKTKAPVSWEDVLSGRGIVRIYEFLGGYKTYKHSEELPPHPDQIFAARTHDERCKDTFDFFAALYGRCAKNFTLDILALGGLYVAGGIAAQHHDVIQHPLFIKEFLKAERHYELLQKVPIYLIADYNVSLYGAAYYLVLEHHRP